MGTFESDAFLDIARGDENVYLDTSFAMATVVNRHVDFDPASIANAVFEELADLIMYGSDFPNMPHAYEREYDGLARRDLWKTAFAALFHGAAEAISRRCVGKLLHPIATRAIPYGG